VGPAKERRICEKMFMEKDNAEKKLGIVKNIHERLGVRGEHQGGFGGKKEMLTGDFIKGRGKGGGRKKKKKQKKSFFCKRQKWNPPPDPWVKEVRKKKKVRKRKKRKNCSGYGRSKRTGQKRIKSDEDTRVSLSTGGSERGFYKGRTACGPIG